MREAAQLTIRIDEATVANVPHFWVRGGLTPGHRIPGLGRKAAYAYRPERSSLELHALSARGVLVSVYRDPAPERDALTSAEAIARTALARVEAAFPGEAVPPHDEPPVAPCGVVTSDDLKAAWTAVGIDVSGQAVKTYEAEAIGFEALWACESVIESPAGHRQARWSFRKDKTPVAAPAVGDPVRGVGRSAWWGPSAGFYEFDESGLTVITKGGRLLEVAVYAEVDDAAGRDAARRTVAVAIGRKLASRLG